LINGWYDIYARDNFMIYANLTVPRRLLVRPTDHSEIEAPGPDLNYAAEAHRWFDYWLRGIDNGIMAEPPIHYYLQGVDKKEAWQSTDVWPLKRQEMTPFYLGAGATGGISSINDGALDPSPRTAPEASDTYTVDYSTTTGKKPHWSALASNHEYPDMRSNDSRALTYTTPPLRAALQVTGHPIAHVWVSSDAPDLDLFAYLEEVDENGNSTYITQGSLRASHRLLSPCPFDNLGLPWRNHFQSELMPLPAGEPVELVFDLLPTSYLFSKGKSIRIAIAFADAGNFDTPVLNPAPRILLWKGNNQPSFIDLPVIPSR
jgi:putative CocE/NonD family hydrolase